MNVYSSMNPIIYIYPAKQEYLPAESIPDDPCRSFHQFAFFTEGNHKFDISGKTLTVSPNSLLYLPKGSKIKFTRDEPAVCYHVAFQLYHDVQYAPFSRNYSNSKQICEIFDTMLHIGGIDGRPGYEYEMMILLYKLMSIIQANENAPYYSSKHASNVSQSVRYILDNYLKEDIPTAVLARICHLSTRYYSSLFNAYYGCSPQKYITQLKINHAKDLLATTDLKVSGIAIECNFSDVYHFCKMFKKITGLSPSEYRRSVPLDPY